MNSFDEWVRFRIQPQRQLEVAIEKLMESTPEQHTLLRVINKRYHDLMRISDRLAADLVAANERLAGRR